MFTAGRTTTCPFCSAVLEISRSDPGDVRVKETPAKKR